MPYADLTPKDIERFWSKVDTSAGPDGCWPWTDHTIKGYGEFCICRDGIPRNLRASRVMWEIVNGPLSADKVMRHTCDNPSCVNPSHLVPGTQAENIQDKVERMRQARGSAHGMARLSEDQVIEIRYRLESGEKIRPLAREFGVSQRTIQRIDRGITWRHFLPPSS